MSISISLPNDELYIYPTDTVWGIGCSIYSKAGYDQIAKIKKTTEDKPLSIMFSSVDEIMKNFKLPKKLTKDWLLLFFSLETTLGLPLCFAKMNFPKWATGESSYVSIRCLDNEIIKKIDHELSGNPFFTTSLNISGEPPITNLLDAQEFNIQHAPQANFISSANGARPLSGSSSTVVFLEQDLSFKILRVGSKIEEVKDLLKKLL